MTNPKTPPPRPPIDWEGLVGELTQYGHDVVERVGEALKTDAEYAKKGEYTADRMLDDVKAFWRAVADDVDRGIENWKKYVEHRGDAS
jgi:hypothetical protein